MDDTNKLLTTIINNQSSMKAELLNKLETVENKLSQRIDNMETKMENGFKKVNKRIDRVGKQLAYLEDDTPTMATFTKLKKQVDLIKLQIA